MKEVTLGEWPSISYLIVSSVSLTVIYLMWAEFTNDFRNFDFLLTAKVGLMREVNQKISTIRGLARHWL